MAQHHVDLLGDIAGALMEVPEDAAHLTVSFFRHEAYAIITAPGIPDDATEGATAAAAIRNGLALRTNPANWMSEAYERAPMPPAPVLP